MGDGCQFPIRRQVRALDIDESVCLVNDRQVKLLVIGPPITGLVRGDLDRGMREVICEKLVAQFGLPLQSQGVRCDDHHATAGADPGGVA